MVEPIIKFVSESDEVKERQLKAFAASVSALGQKMPFSKDLQQSCAGAALTLIDPSIKLTANQLAELPLLANPLVFRFIEPFTQSSDEVAGVKSLVSKGIDIGLLKKNDYFEMPLLRLVFLHALGTKNLDLHEAIPWGGIKDPLDSVPSGFTSSLKKRCEYYQVDAKIPEELSLFASFLSDQQPEQALDSALTLLADGASLGLVYRLQTKQAVTTDHIFELLTGSLARGYGRVFINIVNPKEIQVSYFISNIEEFEQNQARRVGWFVVGARKLSGTT
ncbi:MAG: hypothetical protein HRU09_06910 [Oligoflexales bacterium]|nr:hypothetical protein [Oligoflexales bacterium]